ncbi:MAG: MFS transporter [Chloroflexi bacterium]|nr:MFS transporter [Chloroflexota bacterium]
MSVQERDAQQAPELQAVPDGHGMSINSPNAATATAEGGTIASEAPSRGSPWQALQHHDFRLLWAGGFVSQAGSQMRVVAIGVQLWDLTHNYAALGLLGLFRLLPVLALSLFGGVIADALDRRRLLMATQSVMALSSLTLALSTQFGWVSAPIVYGVSALGAAALAFDNPARSALVPNLVPRRHLANALSLNIIVMQVATIVGPMLGGLFLPLHSTGLAIIYWIDALSFTAVIFAVFVMKARPQQEATRDISFKAALEGLRFLRKAPIIMSTMTLDFFATFFGAAMVLLPAFAENILRVDRQYWGILYAAPAIGAVMAGLVMARIGHVRRQGIVVIISIVFYGLATILFGVSSLFWVTVLALAGTGAADTVSMVMRQTIRQLSTPDELRGRMTSVNMVFYMGGPQLGDMEAGLAAQVIGLGPAIVLGGIGVIVVTAVISYIVPNLRSYVSKE